MSVPHNKRGQHEATRQEKSLAKEAETLTSAPTHTRIGKS